jgi:hypothetical protein
MTLTDLSGVDAGPGTAAFDEVVARVGSADFDAWDRQVRRAGACSHPIRLHGQVTEGGRVVFDTDHQPDRVLLKACGNRRASVCPSCSYIYRGDTWQMLHAGMVGGKGIPESVAEHPAAFVTLTAPSFGAVHGKREGKRPCRHGEGKLCPHGRPLWCRRRHADGDPMLGTPLCPDCYDYEGAVLFNWWAPELWRRFTIQLGRALARLLGTSETRLREAVRISYAKVAEFQKRGLIHFHALIRLDGFPRYGDHLPPPPVIGYDHLEQAVRQAAAHVSYDAATKGRAVRLRFGSQVDVRPVNSGADGELTGEAVAAYISKYATKGTEDLGVGFGLGQAPSPHIRRMLTTGRALAESVHALERMGEWEGMLFFRGHFSTKSRKYSTTLGALRQARKTWQRRTQLEARGIDPDDQDDDDTTLIVARLHYVGRGYTTTGDAVLAASIAARTREARDLARQERATAAR